MSMTTEAGLVLGAIGERDIGHHFPNTDPAIRGISSLEIVRKAGDLVVRYSASLTPAPAMASLARKVQVAGAGRPDTAKRSTARWVPGSSRSASGPLGATSFPLQMRVPSMPISVVPAPSP